MLKMYLLFLMIVYVFASDEDLCKLCDSPKDHIFCIFPDPNPANTAQCADVDVSITNEGFRKKVLDWHNNYRDQFAAGTWKDQGGRFPKAADMRYISYDLELEKLAMRNVQNCYYKHEPCKKTKRFEYGQNMGYYAFSKKDGLPADSQNTWESWVGEMKDFQVSDGNIEKFEVSGSGVILHFTQATWASIQYLGCAQATSKQGEWFRIDVVCNYGPDGNMMGDRLYSIGEPCSKCPSGSKCGSKYTHLCIGGDQQETGDRIPNENQPKQGENPDTGSGGGGKEEEEKKPKKSKATQNESFVFLLFISKFFLLSSQ